MLTLAVFLLAMPVQAQVGSAEMSGVVTDSTGAAVPTAKVIATSADTGFVRETVTGGTGNYNLTMLPPGGYSLTVEAPGFAKLVRSGISLEVNQRATLNLSLVVGQVTSTITVDAAAPLLESQSSSVGNVISEASVADMPLNSRNFVALAILSPGVSGTGFGQTGTVMAGGRPDDSRPGTELFSNGNDSFSNNFTIDGVDNNDRQFDLVVVRPNVDSIREFKVSTNLFSADMGRTSGAQVEVITKSGTNTPHGTLFEFFRNSALDSRSYFNKKPQAFPSFRYNQFGGSLGGPVKIPKVYSGQKTFFFFDYEGFRNNVQQLNVYTVPTAAMKTGDFSAERKIYDPLSTRANPSGSGNIRDPFPGNIILPSRWDSPAAKLVQAFPAPTDPTVKVNNLTSDMQKTQSWNNFDIRGDQQFSSSDTFMIRYTKQHTITATPNYLPPPPGGIPGLPGSDKYGLGSGIAGVSDQPVTNAVASYVHVFTPTLINEVRAGINRYKIDYIAEGDVPCQNLGNKLGIPNSNVGPYECILPTVAVSDYTSIGMSRSTPIFRRSTTYQYTDNVNYLRSLHTLKFGGSIFRRQLSEYQTNSGSGGYNFSSALTNLPGVSNTGNSIASMLLGYPNTISRDDQLVWPGLRGLEGGLYVADDWRPTRRLTLNIGLRWEYTSFYSEVHNQIAAFNLATGKQNIAGRNGVDQNLNVNRTFGDIAPRLGFAYTATPKTVIRGGAGLFYNAVGTSFDLFRLFKHVPFGPRYAFTQSDVFITDQTTGVGPRMSDGLHPYPTVSMYDADHPWGQVYGVSSNLHSGRVLQWNLTVERELTSLNAVVKAAYVANVGRRLFAKFDNNQPAPGPGSPNARRPYANVDPLLSTVTYMFSDGLSDFNSLQLSFQKRLSHGLSGSANYTWSHAMESNLGTVEMGTSSQWPLFDRRKDRGSSPYDIQHRMTINYIYKIPLAPKNAILKLLLGGWQQNGIVSVQSGLPFTPSLQTTTVNTGTSSRPNCLVDATLPSDQRSIAHWFNTTTAFATPALYTYGNCGKNTLRGPGRWNMDASLFKNFAASEKLTFQFRVEAFNVMNHPQFGQPNATIGSAPAGTISSIVGNPRQVQLALRMQF
jgi:hypothetical protein